MINFSHIYQAKFNTYNILAEELLTKWWKKINWEAENQLLCKYIN